ncbi:MAG: hypothetical protein ABI856_12615 [Nitrospira sp.]
MTCRAHRLRVLFLSPGMAPKSAGFGYCLMWVVAGALYVLSLPGCVTEAQTVLPETESRKILLVVRMVAVITGDRARRFEPEVRQVEMIHDATGERFRVTVEGKDEVVAVFLPPGQYSINRVHINEGPFLSMAQLSSSLAVEVSPVVFAGTWRFGVDSPRYGRMVLLSMVFEDEARERAERKIREEYPTLASEPMTAVLPFPAEAETRLYEVMPYPRYPRYFRRHWW